MFTLHAMHMDWGGYINDHDSTILVTKLTANSLYLLSITIIYVYMNKRIKKMCQKIVFSI